MESSVEGGGGEFTREEVIRVEVFIVENVVLGPDTETSRKTLCREGALMSRELVGKTHS
jgi:hypothetical protein